jgi:hypothetical protein
MDCRDTLKVRELALARLALSPAFVARMSTALAAQGHARASNVVPFRARPVTENLLKAAAVLLAGGLGFLVARGPRLVG